MTQTTAHRAARQVPDGRRTGVCRTRVLPGHRPAIPDPPGSGSDESDNSCRGIGVSNIFANFRCSELAERLLDVAFLHTHLVKKTAPESPDSGAFSTITCALRHRTHLHRHSLHRHNRCGRGAHRLRRLSSTRLRRGPRHPLQRVPLRQQRRSPLEDPDLHAATSPTVQNSLEFTHTNPRRATSNWSRRQRPSPTIVRPLTANPRGPTTSHSPQHFLSHTLSLSIRRRYRCTTLKC